MIKFFVYLFAGIVVSLCAAEIPGPQLLREVAYGNNIKKIDSLLSAGSDIRQRDSIGRTIVLAAASGGKEDIFDRIVKVCSAVNDTDKFGSNALMWAVYGGNLSIVKKVCSLGGIYKKTAIIWADSIGDGAYYGSPLNCAAGRDSVPLSIMQFLIDSCKADVNEREISSDYSEIGWIPLHWAVQQDAHDKVTYLISKGASINDCSEWDCTTPISLIKFGSTIGVELLEKGAILDSISIYRCLDPLFQLWNRSTDSTVQMMIENYSKLKNPENVVNKLLLLCVLERPSRNFKKLLEFSAQHSISLDTETLFSQVIEVKNTEFLNELITRKIVIPSKFTIPGELFSDVEETTEVLECRANFQIQSDNWRSDQKERGDSCFQILFNNGFDFENNEALTECFLSALKGKFVNSVKMMKSNGISFECMPEDDRLIVYSLSSDDTSTLRELCDAGHLIKNHHFLDISLESESASTLLKAYELAKTQRVENPKDTAYLMTCVLLAASRIGAVDIVKRLHNAGAMLDLYNKKSISKHGDKVENDSLYLIAEYDLDDNKSIDIVEPKYHNAVAFNMMGKVSIKLLTYLKSLEKHSFKKYLARYLLNTGEYNSIDLNKCDSASFSFILQHCNRSLQSDLIEKKLNNVIQDSLVPIGTYVLQKYRKTLGEEKLIEIYAHAVNDTISPLLNVFTKAGIFVPERTKNPLIGSALVLCSDTVQAEKYCGSRKIYQKYKLLQKCAINGNYIGMQYLLNKKLKVSRREINQVFTTFLSNLKGSNIGKRDSTVILTIVDGFLNAGLSPDAVDTTTSSNLTILNLVLGASDNSTNNIYRSIAIRLINRGASLSINKNLRTSPLITAINSGDCRAVEFLLKKGMNPNEIIPVDSKNYRAYEGKKPLLIAIEKQDPAICRLLINAGATLVEIDEEGNSFIERAIENNMDTLALEVLKKLQPDEIKRLELKNRRYLSLALLNKSMIELVAKLIELGADVNFLSEDGLPLSIAIENVDSSTLSKQYIDLLLKSGVDLEAEEEGKAFLHLATINNNIPLIQKLKAAGMDINKSDRDGNTPLNLAASENNDTLAQDIIAMGADVNIANDKGCTPLFYAARHNNLRLITILLNDSADVTARNDKGQNIIQYLLANVEDSISISTDSTVKLLLAKGVPPKNIQKDGSTILHSLAAKPGSGNLIKRFIQEGVDINAKNDEGVTALFRAVQCSNVDAACELIQMGANLTTRSEDGNTLLHNIAKLNFDLPCIDDVLSKLKSIDICNDDGETPLHLAAKSPSNIFAQLVARGASLNKKDKSGNTPLRLATESGMVNNLAIALKNTNQNTDIEEKKSALCLAIENNSYASVMLLLNANADLQNSNKDRPILRAALKLGNKHIIVALLHAGMIADTIDSLVKELKDEYSYSSDKLDSAVVLLKLPPKSLPENPPIEIPAKNGYWWYSEDIPVSVFKKGKCTLKNEHAASIDESDEMFHVNGYEMRRITRNDYGLNNDVEVYGTTMQFNGTIYSIVEKDDVLYLIDESNQICKAYKFAGTSLPVSWRYNFVDNSYSDDSDYDEDY
jgi:ankyrin repeat protein